MTAKMPTIRDVAERAGVAMSTASRALNGGGASAGAREAVERAARELGYRSDPAARGLAGGRRGVVGVVVRDFTHYYTTEILSAIVDRLRRGGYATMIADAGGGMESDAEAIRDCARASDGMILISPSLDDLDLADLCDPSSTVLVNRTDPVYSSVSLDENVGMERAVRYLADLGHRRIAYAAGPKRSWSGGRRQEAFLRACGRIGVDGAVIGPFEATYRGGCAAADALVGRGDATAVITFNDVLASGLVARLFERGIDVPGGMSVVGMDDSLIARTMRPQLTSVDNRQRDMGVSAVRLLLAKIGRSAEMLAASKRQMVLSGTLVIRGSVGPVGGDRTELRA